MLVAHDAPRPDVALGRLKLGLYLEQRGGEEGGLERGALL